MPTSSADHIFPLLRPRPIGGSFRRAALPLLFSHFPLLVILCARWSAPLRPAPAFIRTSAQLCHSLACFHRPSFAATVAPCCQRCQSQLPLASLLPRLLPPWPRPLAFGHMSVAFAGLQARWYGRRFSHAECTVPSILCSAHAGAWSPFEPAWQCAAIWQRPAFPVCCTLYCFFVALTSCRAAS